MTLQKDLEETKRRNFSDNRSFVRFDKTEVLHGNDWKKRKIELWERCGGRCEYRYINGQQCRGDCNHPHHIKPRWPKRMDNLENLMGICADHHRLLDGRKIGGRKAKADSKQLG